MRTSWGIAVALGLVLLSCSGDDGKDGAKGPAGPKGEKGDTGATGKTGATGPQGDQGDQGDQGPTGDQGPEGPAGPTGPAGPPGPSGEAGAAGAGPVELPDGTLNASCMKPCHTFDGTVEQWKTSRHYATYVANLGGDEAESWTGAKACGNCHAQDGVQQRLAGNVTVNAGAAVPVELLHGQLNYKDASNKIQEAIYAGQATVAVVGCATCHDDSAAHDPHLTGKDYAPGDFPLRVPSGSNDYAIIEKSSALGTSDGTKVKYQVGNACMWCHKSRKDVTNYVLATNNNVSSTNWGPHEGPDADLFTGKGGYEFAGKTYQNSQHQSFVKGCVSCHMAPEPDNMNVGNHSFYPQLETCTASCHQTAKNFNVGGAQDRVKTMLQRLRVALNTLNLLTRDGTNPLTGADLTDTNWNLDKALPKTGVDGPTAGALYDYFLVARASAYGVHNPYYVQEIAYDAIQATGGDLSGLNRP